MRPIVSNVNAPSYKIAKWLVCEVKKLKKIDSFSVKNFFDFVKKISGLRLNGNEIMISFDVASLFPSVPVEIALQEFKKYLDNLELESEKKTIYFEVAQLCMNQSYFQFREKIYKVERGTNMGNPLSPLISELFMSAFEINLNERGLLPRVWHRYVDDVFAIVDRDDIQKILDILNSQYDSINFTCEPETNGKLPFLDLELQRVSDKIDVGVYHKPTSTMRTITSDSHCPVQHKQAAYHALIHRLCRLPLSAANFKREYEYIKETARVNGYSENMIDKLVKKHSNKVKRSKLTSFFTQNTPSQDKQRVSMSFEPVITNKLKSKFAENRLEIVYKNNGKLQNLLGSTKDKIPVLQKSGIYSIECGDCKRKYWGQTKRNIEIRYKDHISCVRLNHPYKSAVASHILVDGHENINIDSLSLVKQVFNERRLDAYEAFYIQCDDNALNQDRGNVESCLLSLAKNN